MAYPVQHSERDRCIQDSAGSPKQHGGFARLFFFLNLRRNLEEIAVGTVAAITVLNGQSTVDPTRLNNGTRRVMLAGEATIYVGDALIASRLHKRRGLK